MGAAVTIHGPQACLRPCVECHPGHHWLPICLPDDPDEDEVEDFHSVLDFDREHGTDHALAFYACKHCPAWISDEDHDVLEEEFGSYLLGWDLGRES
jgi:hypothetical protein